MKPLILELLRDPLWQFVGVVLAIAALAASVVIYSLQRQRKALSYEVLSRNQLLTVREELEGKLQVMYEGHPAKDICLVVLKLTNTGNIPVATTDYERPVSFDTGSSSKILSGVITAKDPENISVDLTIDGSLVVVQPVLLNAKDSITVKLLVSDFSGTVVVNARIVGVKSVARTKDTSGYLTVLMMCGVAVSTLGMYFVISNFPEPQPEIPIPSQLKVGFVLFGIGYLAMILGLLKNRHLRLRLVRAFQRRF